MKQNMLYDCKYVSCFFVQKRANVSCHDSGST